MTNDMNNRIGGEVFDSRDVIELLDSGEGGELRHELWKLSEWGEANVTDWQHGETLIREDYFTEYAREFAHDVGMFYVPVDNHWGIERERKRDLSQEWPFRHIDWEAAAEELKQDYTEVEFKGATYYVRAG